MNGQRREDTPDCICDETEGCFHACPYDVEINDAPEDDETCDCCDACESECAMSV